MSGLPLAVRKKIGYNIEKVASGLIDKEIFKKLGDTNIWEFRTIYNGIAYRLLSFWDNDKGALIIAANGFIKKSEKTPLKEIHKAEEIRKQYFDERKK